MFINKNSIIHKINPIIKLVCLLLLFIPFIASKSIELHIVISFMIIMMIYFSKININKYINVIFSLRYVYIFLLVLLASKGISLDNTLLFFIKITDIMLYLCIIVYTTSISELKYGIELILNPINVLNLKLSRIINNFISIISFFPIFFETEKEVLVMASERGLLASKLFSVISTFNSTLRITLNKLRKIKELSVIRMYSDTSYRTNYRTNKVNVYSIILLVIHLSFVYYYIMEVGLL